MRTLICSGLFLPGGMGVPFSWTQQLPPPQRSNYLPTPLARWALGVTLKGNGSREGGRPTCFSTANGVLALSGRNYFPLWLPAQSGILISRVNGYSSGATMSQSSPLSTLGILRSLELWIYFGPLLLSP